MASRFESVQTAMLARSDAIAAVRRRIRNDFDVMQEATIETRHGRIVFTQTKRFIEAASVCREFAVGSVGTVVEGTQAGSNEA